MSNPAIVATKNVLKPIFWLAVACGIFWCVLTGCEWIASTYKYGFHFNIAAFLIVVLGVAWWAEYDKAKHREQNPPSIWDGRV